MSNISLQLFKGKERLRLLKTKMFYKRHISFLKIKYILLGKNFHVYILLIEVNNMMQPQQKVLSRDITVWYTIK